MGLVQDTRSLAVHIREMGAELTSIADTLETIADATTGCSTFGADDERRRGEAIMRDPRNELADGLDCEALADDAEQYTLMPPGVKIGRRDQIGKKLRSGDYVQVTDSSRYGTVNGFVIGAGNDRGDGKERVLIRLADGRNDRYEPSTGRVTRLLKHPRAEGNGLSRLPNVEVAFGHPVRQ